MTVSDLRFVGDLSRTDAHLLARYASTAGVILEFGVGGSTQIFAQALSENGRVLAIDTDIEWIKTTRARLRRLGVPIAKRVTFLIADESASAIRVGEVLDDDDDALALALADADPLDVFSADGVDLIFIDGIDHLRRGFALDAWNGLKDGGVMIFHDTRRPSDQANVLAVVAARYNEIRSVTLNEAIDGESSNISVITKKTSEPYVNWNLAEERPPWRIGYGEPPESFWPATEDQDPP